MAVRSFAELSPVAGIAARGIDPSQRDRGAAARTEPKAPVAPDIEAEDPADAAPALAEQHLVDLAREANNRLESKGVSLKFSLDETTGRVVLTVVDQETHEVIRQVPSKTALAIAAALDKLLPGVMLEERV